MAEPKDWTEHKGRANSSPAFLDLIKQVGILIRGQAHALINGRADDVAGLIMAQLAHVHGLAPAAGNPDRVVEDRTVNALLLFIAQRSSFLTPDALIEEIRAGKWRDPIYDYHRSTLTCAACGELIPPGLYYSATSTSEDPAYHVACATTKFSSPDALTQRVALDPP